VQGTQVTDCWIGSIVVSWGGASVGITFSSQSSQGGFQVGLAFSSQSSQGGFQVGLTFSSQSAQGGLQVGLTFSSQSAQGGLQVGLPRSSVGATVISCIGASVGISSSSSQPSHVGCQVGLGLLVGAEVSSSEGASVGSSPEGASVGSSPEGASVGSSYSCSD